MKLSSTRLTVITCLLLGSLSFAAFAQNATEKVPSSTSAEKQQLTPEIEMSIMKALNTEDRIANRQAIMPKPRKGEAWAEDVSGEWICFTTMLLNGPTGMGIMQINLEQDGEQLVGEGGQLKHPFDPPSTIRPIGGWALQSAYVGRFYKRTPSGHNMVVFERQNTSGTWAIFTAIISGDGQTATGQIINRGGHYGSMLMVRREALSDFQHMRTVEGRREEEVRRLKGIEQLEAAFDAKSMDTARGQWWKLDKNKDGNLHYKEFPHPDWTRANRDNDEILTWAEELADRVFRSLARKGKYQAEYGASSRKEWSSWHEWGSDRPDFATLFPYIDWNRDGKIIADEYTAFQDQVKTYLDKSFPKTNALGQTGMDILKGRMRGRARKTSWDSQEEWNRDKPTVEWIFPFIDKNSDGKIDSDEYQAIQDYKKKHGDWQDRARKELGLAAPKDQ
jgi:hypothetical protein